jgi:hypothetical protein
LVSHEKIYDQATYMRQMHDWHNHMAHYHEQKRLRHLEMAKHFQQMMVGRVNGETGYISA